jgi:hypothetical protein
MADLLLAQHMRERAIWVYQFGYLDRLGCPVSTNYALDEYAALVIGRCRSIHSGFGSAIQTRQGEGSGRRGKHRRAGRRRFPGGSIAGHPETRQVGDRYSPMGSQYRLDSCDSCGH